MIVCVVCTSNVTSNAFVSLVNRYLNNNQLATLPSGIFSSNKALGELWVVEAIVFVIYLCHSHLMFLFRFLKGILITINWQHYHRIYSVTTRYCIICEWLKRSFVLFMCAIVHIMFFFDLKRDGSGNQLATLPSGLFNSNTALQTLWVVESDCLCGLCVEFTI